MSTLKQPLSKEDENHPLLPPKPTADQDDNQRKLIIATGLCTIFMIAEIVGGYLAHSLAIMTDAAHLLSDIAGFIISIVAISLTKTQATTQFSFGFHRAEIMGALTSVLLIWLLAGILMAEAIKRIITPQFVDGKLMFIVACLGLVVNLLMLCVLGGHGHSHGGGGTGHAHDVANDEGHGHGHAKENGVANDDGHGHGHTKEKAENINVTAAYIHVLGDLVQTVGVILAAVLIWWQPGSLGTFDCSHGDEILQCTNWSYADPICTLLFAVLVLLTTTKIVKDCVDILMIRAPEDVDQAKLLAKLQTIPDVTDIHDFHVWSISTGKNCASMHIKISTVDEHDAVLSDALSIAKDFNCGHTTIQVERKLRTDCDAIDHTTMA